MTTHLSPAENQTPRAQPAASPPVGTSQPQQTPRSVLVVEDEWIIALGVQHSLEEARYRVTEMVPSGEDALAAIQRDRPDLVLVDIVLDGPVDGIALAEKVGRLGIPVVFLTAHADERTLERAGRAGPAAYVVKPFTREQLLSAVAVALIQKPERGRTPSDGPPPKRAQAAAGPHRPELRRLERLLDVAAALGTPSSRSGTIPQGGVLPKRLSRREQDVLRHLLANSRVSTIASDLDISPHTVRNHLKSIYRKFGVHSQAELIGFLTSLE